MHYICARGVDDKYIYANDPNNKTVPRKQAHSKFDSCMKQAFIFWPKKKEAAPENPNSNTSSPATGVNLDGAIIDISKYQGNIDFDTLKPNVSLVIARAGVGSDPDPKFDSYAEEMNRLGIPFGVYCFSYAGTTEKARDEAKKLVARASKHNPLFYVMDAEEEKITHDAIAAFADELRANTKAKIGCYCAHHRYKQYNYAALQSKFDFTWIPCYGSNNGTLAGSRKPSYPCDLWQYTSTGKIAGIAGNTDMNIITGDGHDLQWFLIR